MANSYPRRDQARGIWKINDITKNIKEDGTYPSGATRGVISGGNTPSVCLLYTSPSPRDLSTSRMPSSA